MPRQNRGLFNLAKSLRLLDFLRGNVSNIQRGFYLFFCLVVAALHKDKPRQRKTFLFEKTYGCKPTRVERNETKRAAHG
jgi:hypothetical protein